MGLTHSHGRGHLSLWGLWLRAKCGTDPLGIHSAQAQGLVAELEGEENLQDVSFALSHFTLHSTAGSRQC